MSKKSNTKRAQGKTQISISLDEALVKRIDKQAEADNRNRSNWISQELGLLVKSKEAKQ